MVNFKKKLGKKEVEKKIDPTEIYKDLDRSSAIGPLRPGQEAILKAWFASRQNDKDLIIKLHTGEISSPKKLCNLALSNFDSSLLMSIERLIFK